MSTITDINQLDQSKNYTYADYLTWRLKDRIELIMGRIFRMSPALPDEAGRSRAPSSEHQQTLSALHGNMYQFVKKKDCQVFPSPCDVALPSPSAKLDTAVQPDITVICDLSKITEKGCLGVGLTRLSWTGNADDGHFPCHSSDNIDELSIDHSEKVQIGIYILNLCDTLGVSDKTSVGRSGPSGTGKGALHQPGEHEVHGGGITIPSPC
jgi:hypothetical protein